MTPILGILASSISGSKAVTNSYESIATSTLGSAQSTVTFSSIPQTYKHLQVRITNRSEFVRGSGNTLGVSTYLRVGNSGTIYSANYTWGSTFGDGSSASSEHYGTQNIMVVANNSMPAANSTTGIFGSTIVDILDYTSTNKNKTFRYLSGFDQNGTNGRISFASSLYYGTPNAITDLQFTADGNFAANSTFALYGIKG